MQYAPERLIKTLAGLLAAQNEKHLARMLKISVAVLEGIRTGTVPVTPLLLRQMADRVGTTVDALRLILGDRRRKARMAFQLAPALRAA